MSKANFRQKKKKQQKGKEMENNQKLRIHIKNMTHNIKENCRSESEIKVRGNTL